MLDANGNARDADGDAAEYALVVARSVAGECCVLDCPAAGEMVVRLLRWDGNETSAHEEYSPDTKRDKFNAAMAYARKTMADMVRSHGLAAGA